MHQPDAVAKQIVIAVANAVATAMVNAVLLSTRTALSATTAQWQGQVAVFACTLDSHRLGAAMLLDTTANHTDIAKHKDTSLKIAESKESE